jgi:hypothetical protein
VLLALARTEKSPRDLPATSASEGFAPVHEFGAIPFFRSRGPLAGPFLPFSMSLSPEILLTADSLLLNMCL